MCYPQCMGMKANNNNIYTEKCNRCSITANSYISINQTAAVHVISVNMEYATALANGRSTICTIFASNIDIFNRICASALFRMLIA